MYLKIRFNFKSHESIEVFKNPLTKISCKNRNDVICKILKKLEISFDKPM